MLGPSWVAGDTSMNKTSLPSRISLSSGRDTGKQSSDLQQGKVSAEHCGNSKKDMLDRVLNQCCDRLGRACVAVKSVPGPVEM